MGCFLATLTEVHTANCRQTDTHSHILLKIFPPCRGVTEVGPITAFTIPIRKSLSQSLLSGCVRPPTPVHAQLLTTGGNYRGRPIWEYTFQILADFTFPVLKFYMHFCVHSLADYSTGALIKYSCSMGAYWLFEFLIKLTTRSLSY